MSATARDRKRNGFSPAFLLSVAVVCLALPSAVLAFSSGIDGRAPTGAGAPPSMETLERLAANPPMARSITVPGLTHNQMFRFTPAGSATRPGRSVTVAVRVDSETARAITVRAPLGAVPIGSGFPGTKLRLPQVAYSLGVSRGFQSFVIPGDLHRSETPDLSAFKLGQQPAAADEPSRLNARLALDQREKTGRAPRTLESSGEQTVDFGGSYRLTRNIDVTAGVRYSQERDRLLPLVDGQKDNQAVYVGTQFRF